MTVTADAVLFVQPRHRLLADLLEARGIAVHRHFDGPSETVLDGPAAAATVLITSALPAPRPWFLDRLQRLKLVHSPAAGYESIDLEWCRDHGVAAGHMPGVNAPEVAEHAIGLTLAAWRRIVSNDALVRNGGWSVQRSIDWPSFHGSKVGIVGLGATGNAVADRLAPFGVEIAWWGPRAKPDVTFRRMESVLALAQWADIVIVTARGGEESRHVVTSAVMDAIGPCGLLVNVSRGSVLDENALIDALREGRLGQAAIDAFAQEPTPPARWSDVPNIILSPHTAGATRASIRRLFELAAEDIAGFLTGNPLRAPLA